MNINPCKSIKKNAGERDITVSFAGVIINLGNYIYADEDGFIIANKNLAD